MRRFIQLLIVSLFVMPGIARAALNVQITNTASSGGSFVGGVWTPTASPSRINVTDLLNQLNAGNVTVNTNAAGAEAGDITVSSTVALDLMTTTSLRTLTLNALDDVIINAAFSQSGGGSSNQVNLVFNADTDSSGAGGVTLSSGVNSGGGNVVVSGAGISQGVGGAVSTGGVNATITSTAGFTLSAPLTTSGGSLSVSSTGTGNVSNDITTSGGSLTVSAGGNLTVTSGTDLNASGGAGTGLVTVRSLGGLLDFSGVVAGGIGIHVMRGSTGVLFQGGSTVNVGQLDVDATGTGNIEIRNLANLTLTQSATFDTQNGDILLVSGANFTSSVSTSLAMVARGPTGDVSIADPILLDDAGATLALTADADVLVSAALTTTNGTMSLTGKNVTASGQLNTNGGNLGVNAPTGTVSLPASAGITTVGGSFTLSSASFTIGTFITTSGASLDITASGAGTLANDITSSGGNITVNCGGNFTSTPGSVMDASGGAGTGVVNARSTGGLLDLQAGIVGGFATQVLAGATGVILRASFSVRALDLDVTGTGDIDLRAGTTLTVGTSATLDTANGDILLNGTTNFGASGGMSTLTARGTAGDVRVNAGMTVGFGGITLRADNDVVVGALITQNGGPCTLRSDLDNNGVGVISTSTTLSTAGGSLAINGATFSLGGAISTSGANVTLNTTGSGSFGNDITTSGGSITATAGGSISTAAGADLDVSGGAGTGGLSLTSTAGQVTIGGTLRASGGDVVVSGNTGVIFDGDITGARNVDVDCVTGNIAINATASIVNSGTLMAFDTANSTITTAAGAIITPGTNSKLHMQVRTGSNNLTITMPLAAGTGGLELLSDNNVVINSAISTTGPITVRGDVNLGGVGTVNASASITSSGQNIAIEGKGITLASVSSGFGSISILNLGSGTALNFNGNISCDGSVLSVDTTASPTFAAGVTFNLGVGGNALYIITRGASLTIPANININNADEVGFTATGAGVDITINRAFTFGSVGATFVADDTLTVNAPLTGTGPVEFNAQNGALSIASGATVVSGSASFFGTGITLSAPVSVTDGKILITNDGPTLALNSNLTTGGGDISITSGVAMTFPVAPAAPVWDLGLSGVVDVGITAGNINIPSNVGINNILRLVLTGGDISLNRAVGVGVGGIDFQARGQLDINSTLTSTGAINLRADSDADTSGVLFVSAAIAGANQPVTLRGSGVAILANVDTTTGEIRIEPGVGGSANIAAALLGPSRLINGTTTFTVGSITGNSLIVNTGAALAFDSAARTISPSTFTQQNPLGETRIRLGGTGAGQFNRVISTGNFTAGGKLTVQLQSGFTPTAGMSFDVLDFTSFSGAFSSTNLPALGVNQVWDTSQLATTGTLRILTPIQLWRQQYFGIIANAGNAADTADPDGDGAINALEYALGMVPTQSGTTGLPILGKINLAGDDFLTLTFTRPVSATDATYRVLAGSTPAPADLGSFYSITGDTVNTAFTTQVSRTIVGANETIIVRDNTPINFVPQRFLRLRVQTP